MRHLFALFLASLLLWTLTALANHYVAPLHVFLFVGGLFVTFPAMALPPRLAIFAALLAGLLCDAGTSVRFGLHALLFGLATAGIVYLRDRLAREETILQTFIAVLANVVLFLALALTQLWSFPAPGALVGRMLWDLLWSLVFIALVGPWFFALQRRTLELADAVATSLHRRKQVDRHS